MQIKTVKVQSGDSFIVINESDYDPEKQKLYKEKKQAAPKKKKADAPDDTE